MATARASRKPVKTPPKPATKAPRKGPAAKQARHPSVKDATAALEAARDALEAAEERFAAKRDAPAFDAVEAARKGVAMAELTLRQAGEHLTVEEARQVAAKRAVDMRALKAKGAEVTAKAVKWQAAVKEAGSAAAGLLLACEKLLILAGEYQIAAHTHSDRAKALGEPHGNRPEFDKYRLGALVHQQMLESLKHLSRPGDVVRTARILDGQSLRVWFPW